MVDFTHMLHGYYISTGAIVYMIAPVPVKQP